MKTERYVYFIYSRELGAVKVGVSNNPWFRLRALQTGYPYPLQLLGVLETGSADMERTLHASMTGRLTGEWFLFAPNEQYIWDLLITKQGSLRHENDAQYLERVKQRIETFMVTPDLREWATANTPHVNVERLTEKWRAAVRRHNYQNAKGLVESASDSWKLAMLDAERKELNRERTSTSAGLATKHGIRYYEDFKLERELRQVSPTVTTGSFSPMLSVRSNG